MLRLSLDEIEEKDLQALEKNEIPESIRLEFKRQLDLDDKKQKAEAAKDVSAMANTAGGRILYGVDEKKLPNGSTVASSICPLADGAVDSRLEDILLGNMFPRPRFRTRKVSVSGGFVLVVEVYPAYGGDLHLVTGFKENRFYRRGEQRTVLMTEPEIREAYARIAASRLALDAAMQEAVSSELEFVRNVLHSALVVPWYGHRDLVNPRHFGSSLGLELANAGLFPGEWHSVVGRLRVVSDGYRAYSPEDAPIRECAYYASIRRTGLVHLAHGLQHTTNKDYVWLNPGEASKILTAVLSTARYILDKAAYWGPVRVEYRLNAQQPFHLEYGGKSRDFILATGRKPVDIDRYVHAVPEVTLKEQSGSFDTVLAELMDQVYQTGGQEHCP
ncbi:MAG: ATP-binding protein [Candidatus Nealsonbacteria bacterium]|nr:ATP-binding protein [Candidatus Nealsonbacteria bacterium]